MLPFAKIKKHVVDKLEKGLSPALTYHNISHTLDVLEQAEAIAIAERVTSEEDLLLIKISALYHDVGFIKVYGGHEEESCVRGYRGTFIVWRWRTTITKSCGYDQGYESAADTSK
jgi:HD superfamily phosphodiesterase